MQAIRKEFSYEIIHLTYVIGGVTKLLLFHVIHGLSLLVKILIEIEPD